MEKLKISFAPLQGFTEYTYRNIHSQLMGGVDDYYAPYLRLYPDDRRNQKQITDIDPKNNTTQVIPQVLVNNETDFLRFAHILEDFGYSEMNLNLGCPYPMVTNRNLGSGLLSNHDTITNMLDSALPKTKIKLSVKMRVGLTDANEGLPLVERLNNYDLTKLIIHPRNAKQLYKGNANIDLFKQCIPLSRHKLVYNGDITDLESFQTVANELPEISEFMIGRGLLFDPFLGIRIKDEKTLPISNKTDLLKEFHDTYFEISLNQTSGFSHTHQRMLQFWSYFAYSFNHPKKAIKLIKKVKNITKYSEAVDSIFII